MKSRKRWLKQTLVLLALLFVVLSVLPFVLPRGATSTGVPERPFADSRFTIIDGIRWHHRAAGPVSGDLSGHLVVLIHGFSGSTANWERTRTALHERGWRSLAIDLPAFGYSDREQLPVDETDALWRLVDEQNRGQTVALVGHSMGAGVVTRMALAQPKRVSSLVLVDGGPAITSRGTASGGLRAGLVRTLLGYPPVIRWVDWYASHWLYTPQRFSQLLTGAFGRTPSPAEVESYLKPMLVKGTSEAILRRMSAPRPPWPADAAQRLTMTTTLIWGREDRWVPLTVGQRAQQQLPGASLEVIDGAGHNPMETHIDAFTETLLNALGSRDPTPAEPEAAAD